MQPYWVAHYVALVIMFDRANIGALGVGAVRRPLRQRRNVTGWHVDPLATIGGKETLAVRSQQSPQQATRRLR